MNTFTSWLAARTFAIARANEWNTPQGIEKTSDGLFKVRCLPRMHKRFGVDLWCETVEPGERI